MPYDEDDGVDDSKPVALVSSEFLITAFWNAAGPILAVTAGALAMTGFSWWVSGTALLGSFIVAALDLGDAAQHRTELRSVMRQFGLPGPSGPLPFGYMLDYAPLLGLAASCIIMPAQVGWLFSTGYGSLIAGAATLHFLSSFLGRAHDQDLVPYALTQTSIHSDRLGLAMLSSLLAFGLLTGGSGQALAGFSSFLPTLG